MSDVVSFKQMKDGTAEDYQLLGRLESEDMKSFPDRVLGWLRTMEDSAGYQVTRLEHSLQAATRAHRAGEDEETVVCALLHDIGDHLAPANHSEVAAAVLRPFVSEKNYWIVKHHGVFQGYYYFHHFGMDPNARDQWKRSSLLPTNDRLLRELRPDLVRPGLRLQAVDLLRADGAPRPGRDSATQLGVRA